MVLMNNALRKNNVEVPPQPSRMRNATDKVMQAIVNMTKNIEFR